MSNPFERPKAPSKGDRDPDTIYLSVGRALSMWEHTEADFSRLFSHLITPGRGSGAARRAYGSIASSNGRRDLIEKAGSVFFQFFPQKELQESFINTVKLYADASARRNDIAHGIVVRFGKNMEDGYFLSANMYTSKTPLFGSPSYYYTTHIIMSFFLEFEKLGDRANGIVRQIEKHYYASPKTPRERY
jgi:hypothetical protein